MKKSEIKFNYYSGKGDLNAILQEIVRIKLKKQFHLSLDENMIKRKCKVVKKP